MFSVSQKEKILFAEHLSLMIKGGIPLAEALETLSQEAKSRHFKKILTEVIKRILEGENLNKSLAQHPKVFNNFFQNVIKIGEESGTLEENLKYLSSYLQGQYSLRRKIIGALIYPIIIIAVALIVVLVVTLFIFPKLHTLLLALDIPLPFTTQLLLILAGLFEQYWIFILIGIFLYFLISRAFQTISLTRFYLHKRNLLMPVFGQIEKNRNLVEFSRILYTLLKSGLPILNSLDICIEVLPNEVYRKGLLSVRSGVERGQTISHGLKSFPQIFPLIFSQMVLIGEKTGSLEESFLYLSQFYEREINSTIENLSRLLEPLLLILVGFFVIFIALAIIAPIYQFSSALRIQ